MSEDYRDVWGYDDPEGWLGIERTTGVASKPDPSDSKSLESDEADPSPADPDEQLGAEVTARLTGLRREIRALNVGMKRAAQARDLQRNRDVLSEALSECAGHLGVVGGPERIVEAVEGVVERQEESQREIGRLRAEREELRRERNQAIQKERDEWAKVTQELRRQRDQALVARDRCVCERGEERNRLVSERDAAREALSRCADHLVVFQPFDRSNPDCVVEAVEDMVERHEMAQDSFARFRGERDEAWRERDEAREALRPFLRLRADKLRGDELDSEYYVSGPLSRATLDHARAVAGKRGEDG